MTDHGTMSFKLPLKTWYTLAVLCSGLATVQMGRRTVARLWSKRIHLKMHVLTSCPERIQHARMHVNAAGDWRLARSHQLCSKLGIRVKSAMALEVAKSIT